MGDYFGDQGNTPSSPEVSSSSESEMPVDRRRRLPAQQPAQRVPTSATAPEELVHDHNSSLSPAERHEEQARREREAEEERRRELIKRLAKPGTRRPMQTC